MRNFFVIKVLTRQSIQGDQIFIFKIKGSTFAVSSPISNFDIFKIGKLSWNFSLSPHWGSKPLLMIIFAMRIFACQMKKSPAILKNLICSTVKKGILNLACKQGILFGKSKQPNKVPLLQFLVQYQILTSSRLGNCPEIFPWALIGGLNPCSWSSLLCGSLLARWKSHLPF